MVSGWLATGVGSLPGTDPQEAAAVVAGELADWPHLAELPGRGPAAQMIGRAMGQVCSVSSEFAVETAAGGWRRTRAPGRDMRRAEAFLRADFDAAEGSLLGHSGLFAVPIAGPWTLAASVSDEWGERALRDAGYVAELCRAHAEAAAELVARARRMLPGASVVLSVDEPMLAAVHQGRIPFTSGYRRHRAVGVDELVAGLRWSADSVRAAGGTYRLHMCAAPVWPVLQALRPDWLSLDVRLLGEADTEPFGTWLESGAGSVWGVWPTAGPAARDEAAASRTLIEDWLRRLGLSPSTLRGPAAVSPRCGLGGLTPPQAMSALRGVRQVARQLGQI